MKQPADTYTSTLLIEYFRRGLFVCSKKQPSLHVKIHWSKYVVDPGSRIWDVQLYRLCSFFNIFQKREGGGCVKPMLKKYRFRKGILT